ncbi:MAG TPA: peptidoglycan editing factor PgeF [Candidatus Polarisedimenticolia bacterium]|nr:peptidoglycan editing factor PgeF [Candidatus Polarisedimenticolia bacterium]
MTTKRPADAATICGSGPNRLIEVPILASIPGLLHGFTVKGSDTASAISGAAGGDMPLVTLRQVHGAVVRVIEPPGRSVAAARQEGDALIVKGAGVAAGVWVADCLPILICDDRTRTAAAVHAGWRGTVAGVVEAAIALMRSRFRAEPSGLRLAMGPAIGPCCFEVGDEVVDALLRARPEAAASVVTGAKKRIDLVEENRRQARVAGVPDEAMQASGLCTRCRPDLLESYRREGAGAGRMAGFIAWRN